MKPNYGPRKNLRLAKKKSVVKVSRPEVTVQAPKKATVKVNVVPHPEATRPVTPKQRKAIEKNVVRVQREVATDKVLEQTRNVAKGVRIKKKDGLGLAGVGKSYLSAMSPALVLSRVGRAIGHDPKKVGQASVKTARDTVLGIPSGIAATIKDPGGAGKAIAKDYVHRYGTILEGDQKKIDKLLKEQGVTPYLLDASAAGVPAGRILSTTAKSGAIGKAAKAIAEAPRPKLRVSGGIAKEQEVSPNFFKAAAQKGKDKARESVQARRVVKAEKHGTRVRALQPSEGEVAPIRSGERTQRRLVAKTKGRRLDAMKHEQAVEVHRGAAKDLGQLSKHERKGVKYAMQLGLPGDPKRAAALLARRKGQIEEVRGARAEAGSPVELPRVVRKTNDELPQITNLIEQSEKTFTPKLRATADALRTRDIRVAKTDPGLAAEQRLLRRYAPQAEFLKVTRKEGEKTPAFVRRVQAEADKHGLAKPAYFPSEKRPTVRYSDYAVGGTKVVAEDKSYTGELFRTGRENTNADVALGGLARNIKRKHNWNLVAENFDRHSFDWSRDKTVPQLLDELDKRGIDPGDVGFWNPRKFRESQRATSGLDEVERTGYGNEPVAEGITQAIDHSTSDVRGLATLPEEFRSARGWSIVPKAVYDEIHADTRKSGAFGRSLDIAKGKQSRILLGTSPKWLQMQIASNGILTGLAGTGPVDIAKAQMWWKKRTPEERAAIEPYVGIGHFQGDIQQTKLGAASNNHFVNAYRAFKATPFMKKLGRGNPLDALFRIDNAQNNFFRKAVLYSQVKRAAYRKMGQEMGQMARLQGQLTNILKLGPEEQMKAIIRDHDALERHAQHVNDFLGDYATYTAAERRILGRNVMFYGFLRYSLQFTLYTLPIKHPIVSAIVGNLSRMQTQEVRKLLGGDVLPFSFGKLYFAKDGKLRSLDLQSANPAANILTTIRAPRDVLHVLPPIAVASIEQAFEESSLTGKDWATSGRTRPASKLGGYPAEDRARIFMEEMLRLAAPYRIAENVTKEGPEGDDTLLFDKRPTRYVRPDIIESIEKSTKERKARPLPRRILEEVTPFVTRPSFDKELAESNASGGKVKVKATGPDFSHLYKGLPQAVEKDYSHLYK